MYVSRKYMHLGNKTQPCDQYPKIEHWSFRPFCSIE